MHRRPIVGVMGGGDVDADTETMAEALGAAIARQGWVLLNGGRPEGVMAASARGAHASGGLVVGIHPGRPGDAVADVDVAVFTGMGDGRNAINVLSSDVVVALAGGAGTLSEIALARKTGRPLIVLASDQAEGLDGVERVDDVESCIGRIHEALDDRWAETPIPRPAPRSGMRATWADLQQEKGPFFKVLASTPRSQTGFMTIPPGTEAGPPETHAADQVFYFVEGEAEVKVWDDGAEPDHRTVGPGTVLVVPEGVRHWVKSVGQDDLLFFSVYAPPAY